MDFSVLRPISQALLHEGSLLYPYRRSSLKNQRPFAFGTLYPAGYCRSQGSGESSFLQVECLLRGTASSKFSASVRFLQLRLDARAGEEEHEQREVTVGPLALKNLANETCLSFRFAPVEGRISVRAEWPREGVWRLRLRVENSTPFDAVGDDARDRATCHSLLSCQVLLGIEEGEFVSLLEPPCELKELVAQCRNTGVWPVLAGRQDRPNMMIAPPIILYDYPRIAAESRRDFFDSTEIDEMLALRLQTLASDEMAEVALDSRGRALLNHVDRLGTDEMLSLHGVFRDQGPPWRRGMRVRLRPRGTDVFDLALAGKIALISAIDEDVEGQTHVSVVIEDDPGMDLGLEGKPGHRFFFRPEELERVDD